MAHFFDPIMGGYRMVCEATGDLSPGVVTRDGQALEGVEWYSDAPAAHALYLARQRARFKASLVGQGVSSDEAEDAAIGLRWDTMPDGRVAELLPTPALVTAEEAVYPKLQRRARVVIFADKARFTANGTDAVMLMLTGLVDMADVDLGGGLTAFVTPEAPTVRITSDVPRVFTVRLVDALHWSRPLLVEAA